MMEDPVIQAFTVALAICLAALIVLGIMAVRETFKIRKLKAKQR